ncbi:MAG: LapA family protein [Thermodesulfovibrio sp.]|nr:LapA family protein [Thermodesulfovibrio sp.]
MQTFKLIIILLLIVFLGIVIIQNTQPIQTKIIFFTVEMPLILLLILTAITGFALGILVILYKRIKEKK